ncbi:MAG: ABC transporter substrate-binding protein, partial [Gemmatimonadaceae bacterium]
AYDTAAAKAMLDSSGWRAGADGMRSKNGRPLRFAIVVPPSLPRRKYSVLLQEQFKKVGARVDIDQVDNKALGDRMDARDFDALLQVFSTDPSVSGVKQAWGTAGIGPDGQNFMRYSDPKFDALIDSAMGSFDIAKRKSYTTRAFQTVIDDAPAIFLYDVLQVYGINKRITLAPMRTDEWWANLGDWSIPPGKRIDRDRVGLSPAKH